MNSFALCPLQSGYNPKLGNGLLEQALLGFLSRLCGGESTIAKLMLTNHFLSRLCGGESILLKYIAQEMFLSRLCGGEYVL